MGTNDFDFVRTRCPVCKGSGEDVALSLEWGEGTPSGYLPVKCMSCRGTGRWITETDGAREKFVRPEK